MKNFFLVLFISLSIFSLKAQVKSDSSLNPNKPKLVVGVVVDQMRYDYLSRFWNKYGEDGFKRLIKEGYNFKNNHFNYIPTYTAPGHTSIYTGTSPENHGIIGNAWYDKNESQFVYCTSDDSVESVGTKNAAGKMSPRRMMSTTVSDENRLFTEMRGKTIGIALKDRGAILPAGHTANAAYWFHGKDEGKFITSSYYMKDLPKWVKDFNKSGIVTSYMKPWNTLLNIEEYTESGADKNVFETGYVGQEFATFPYDLPKLQAENGQFDLLKETPYGNSITTDFAIAALNGENLGKDDYTDFLTVSFSSTDYIGHNFGVNSKEIEDAYLRLDLDLARLLKALDEKVGEGNYTLFLTADHGGGDVPSYLASVNIPSGYFDDAVFDERLKEFVKERFKEDDLIEMVSNSQIFFNYEAIENAKLDVEKLEKVIARFILQYPQVNNVFTRTQMQDSDFNNGAAALVQNGFNQKRSGDVILILEPATITYSKTGSTHGSGFSYDTHAPLLFFGKGIPHGATTKRSEVIDIAPTISALLGIEFPNSTTGIPLSTLLDN
ncbi:alkaline phosphatase family protein [Gillisia sp. M10.2A]|uniref:Alkaline phosphatase family protein n=1 Tax=Gillisia lutea TaxID=2909668 RepID=A0ABS9EHA4_9FLAO|nr:alkaline phosphatase PafA [Gillisia lutea]MCF4102231.1 alkaline phosphatase family protein [Gillisia lutea]